MIRVLLTLMLCMVTPLAAATVQIAVHADRTDLVLGEALNLEIRIQGADPPALDALTLDELRADFDVAAVSRGVRAEVAMISVTLYPLRRGAQRIPAFKFLGASSAPLALTVRDVGQNIPRVLFRSGIEPAAPRVRQATQLYLDVLDNGSLQWAPIPMPEVPGVHLRALAESQREEVVGGTKYVVHRHAWAMLPLRDGPLRVSFPRLNATKFGVRLRYAAAPFTFSAEAIPAWLPVHVPIGALQLSSDALPATIKAQQPFNWQLRVSGAGLSEQGIAKAIGAVLRNNDAIYFYPPTVRLADTPRGTGLQQTFLVTIPLRILHSGELELPRMVLPYYDTTREQLDAVSVDAPRIAAIDPVARLTMRVVAGLAVLLIGVVFMVHPSRVIRRVRTRAAALCRVRHAADMAQLKDALLHFDCDGEVAPAVTLGRWLQRTGHASAELKQAVRQLEQSCYGRLQQKELEMHTLQSRIVAELQR